MPFQFHVRLPESAIDPSNAGAPTRLTVTSTLLKDVLQHSSKAFSPEDVITIHCSPQAVFRVRPASRCSSTLSGHGQPILCAAFSPTGKLLATGSGDATARLWDLSTELPSHTLVGHKGWVLCCEWEPRGRKLATGGHDNQVGWTEIPFFGFWVCLNYLAGPIMGPQNRQADRGRSQRAHKMDNIACLGTRTYVCTVNPHITPIFTEKAPTLTHPSNVTQKCSKPPSRILIKRQHSARVECRHAYVRVRTRRAYSQYQRRPMGWRWRWGRAEEWCAVYREL